MKKNKKAIILMLILIISSFFLDNVAAETYNNYENSVVSCGRLLITNIPLLIPQVIRIAYIVIQIAVPVVLVVMGSLDFFKAISAQKEDEIKKSQQVFIKRLINAAIIFFVFSIVKIVISFVADSSGNRILECTQCFIEEKCDK